MKCPGCGKLTDWAHDVKLCTRIDELEQQLETVTNGAYSAAAKVAREHEAKWTSAMASYKKNRGSVFAIQRVWLAADVCADIARAIEQLKEN